LVQEVPGLVRPIRHIDRATRSGVSLPEKAFLPTLGSRQDGWARLYLNTFSTR